MLPPGSPPFPLFPPPPPSPPAAAGGQANGENQSHKGQEKGNRKFRPESSETLGGIAADIGVSSDLAFHLIPFSMQLAGKQARFVFVFGENFHSLAFSYRHNNGFGKKDKQ